MGSRTKILCATGLVSLAALLASPAAQASPTEQLQEALQNVNGNKNRVFDAKDSEGNALDTLKVVVCRADCSAPYLGIYHSRNKEGVFNVNVAVSDDLVHWKYLETIDENASQPTIATFSDQGWVVAYQNKNKRGDWRLRVRYYDSQEALTANKYSNQYDDTGAEDAAGSGTPDITSVKGDPSGEGTVSLRFHDYDGKRDQQSRGVLTNFDKMEVTPRHDLTALFDKLGFSGSIGDRDNVTYQDTLFDVVEAQRTPGDWASWRTFLVSPDSELPLRLKMDTPNHSRSFSNPTVSVLPSPDGEGNVLLMTQFIRTEGAGKGEAGELLYWTSIK